MKTENDYLVSIGLPVFNGGNLLEKAIVSLIEQSHKNIELIISDNASTDKTARICSKFKKRDKRIRYFRQKNNIGGVDNFNFVLKKARGDFFLWAAHDDVWHKDFIKYLLRSLIKTKSILAVPNYSLIDNGKITNILLNNKNKLSRKNLVIDYLKNVTKNASIYPYGLMKTDVIKKIAGFHKDWRPYYNASDYLTILKILFSGKVSNVNKILFYKTVKGYYYRKNELFSNLSIDRHKFKLILRYLCDPIYNLLDLYYSIKYLFVSTLTTKEKIILSLHFLYKYLNSWIQFFFLIFTGIINFCLELVKKLVANQQFSQKIHNSQSNTPINLKNKINI